MSRPRKSAPARTNVPAPPKLVGRLPRWRGNPHTIMLADGITSIDEKWEMRLDSNQDGDACLLMRRTDRDHVELRLNFDKPPIGFVRYAKRDVRISVDSASEGREVAITMFERRGAMVCATHVARAHRNNPELLQFLNWG